MMASRVERYCCGCGLCSGVCDHHIDARGYYRPTSDPEESGFDTSVCYCNSLTGAGNPSAPWGPLLTACYSWSSNPDVRHAASSGGTLTALCAHLLRNGMVDGVVQVSTDPEDPMRTTTVVSETPDEVLACAGSRYTASSPYVGLFNRVDQGKRYAVVAKPCDIRVLRSWLVGNADWKNTFPYLLSFFCGGTPTAQANDRLLASMGGSRDNLSSFRYSGCGWPGMTTAAFEGGTAAEMEYEKSWGQILGRDLQEVCRFCWEGTGEAADLSCGDGWYLVGGHPSFKEADGRNVTFARTKAGEELLRSAVAAGVLETSPLEDLEVVNEMQPGQCMRKSAMHSFILAMRLARKQTPSYSLRQLACWQKRLPLAVRCKMFLGTLRRIASGKIE